MKNRQQGIALLEALVAIVILGIGLLGTVGLQARAYSALSEAGMRAEATIATEKLIGVMSNDLANASAYAVAEGAVPPTRLAAWYAETQANIPGAVIKVVVTPVAGLVAGSRFQVDAEIRWTRKAGGQPNTHKLTAHIAQA
jgi:type IV pilus assembly protein PilV